VPDFVSLQTALSGLRAAQAQMNTIGQNMANVDTPGYTRQLVDLTEAMPYQSPSGWMGTGVDVSGINRARDAFLDARVRSTSDTQAGLQARADLLQSTETVMGEPSQGISGPLAAVWSAFENAASSPADTGARTAALSALDNLATRVRQVAAGWSQIRGDVQQSLSAAVTDVNSRLGQLATLNGAIAAASPSGSPNDLLDQRDVLLDKLATEAGATSILSADGTARVLIGGLSVVNGTSATPLTLQAGGALADPSGNTAVAGGTIGGYQTFLSSDLPAYQAQLDGFATDLATALNAQHANGFTPAGQPGGPLLTYTASAAAATLSAVVTDPSQLALSSAAGPPFPTYNGVNAQALADLRTAPVASGGTLSLGGALQSLVTGLAASTSNVVGTAQSQSSLLQSIQSARTGSQGVSIDEEMANMMEAQRAYQAAARVMTVVDENLDTLVNHTGIVGR
jgi:flagellar hook-associated protein 1 FlgK